MEHTEKLLRELVEATERRVAGETLRKRQNIISARMEVTLAAARLRLGMESTPEAIAAADEAAVVMAS